MSTSDPVRLGPMTQRVLSVARWSGEDLFPAHQVWADDAEEVFAFLDGERRFETFLKDIQNVHTTQHRDARLAEARGAFHLSRNGFRMLQWEPSGERLSKGEILVSISGAPNVFVEVKQPGWQGEYMPRRKAERKTLSQDAKNRFEIRKKQGKYLDGEGGVVAPHMSAMDVVRRNALPKLRSDCPNLVIVVDDLIVTPVGLPGLAGLVRREFSNPAHDPDDQKDVFTYERLGGVLFLHPEAESGEIYYRTDFVVNEGALPACALPPAALAVLFRMRDESSARRRQQYPGGSIVLQRFGRKMERQATPEPTNSNLNMSVDLRNRPPVVCPDCGQHLYITVSDEVSGKATFGSCRCDREVYDIPKGSVVFGPKNGMFVYGPEIR